MKKINIIILGFFLTLNVYSQEYHKLIEENKYFDVGLYEPGHICGWADSPPRRYYFEGDTLINGEKYSRLFYYNMIPTWGDGPPFCPPFKVDTIKHEAYFFIREDTLMRTVYRCCNGMYDEEELLFDFSLNQGDTLLGHHHTIDTIVNIVTLDNKTRKMFYITEFPDDGGYFIEGIGGNRGPFIFPEPNFEGRYFTMCIKSNDSTIYVNNSASYENDCFDFITSINYEKINLNYKISPNPTKGKLILESDIDEVDYSITIFDLQGREIMDKRIQSNSFVIDISSHPKGIYFLKVQADGRQETIKIVLQ